MRRLLIFFITLILFAGPARAGDDIQGVTAVWRDFVASIRRGDYPNAHSLFSAQSRTALSYKEFLEEYGPLSVAREMVLAKPESQATDLGDDWAEITYGGVNPGSGRKFRVGVSFVKNEGGWGLVAARNETVERVEAGARTLLRMLWSARSKAPARELVTALTKAQTDSPILQFYRLETDGTAFRAFPAQKGLRTFYVDGFGQVKSVERTPPPPKRTSAAALNVPKRSALANGNASENGQAVKKKPAKKRDEMEELAEPSMPRRGKRASAPVDELAEPPMPSRGARSGAVSNRPPAVALPDSIR